MAPKSDKGKGKAPAKRAASTPEWEPSSTRRRHDSPPASSAPPNPIASSGGPEPGGSGSSGQPLPTPLPTSAPSGSNPTAPQRPWTKLELHYFDMVRWNSGKVANKKVVDALASRGFRRDEKEVGRLRKGRHKPTGEPEALEWIREEKDTATELKWKGMSRYDVAIEMVRGVWDIDSHWDEIDWW